MSEWINDPATDFAIVLIYWAVIAHGLMRLWECRHRIYDWLIWWNWRRW